MTKWNTIIKFDSRKNGMGIFAITAVFFSLALGGCGNQTTGESQGEVKVLEQMSQEERLQTFDQQLAEIHDEASAKVVLTNLGSYVLGTPAEQPVGTLGTASNSLFSTSVLDKLAKKELAARGIGGSLATTSEESTVTPEQFANVINEVAGQQVVSSEQVQEGAVAVRQELPHIKGEDPSKIAPTEALVLGYVMTTGDQGQSEPGTYQDLFPQDKVETFVTKLTE